MAVREGRWDCPSCGSTGIFGRHVECPSCGKPRPAGVRFYLSDDAPILVDPERLAEARAGADWVCEHCGASNRASHQGCGGCGAPQGSSPRQPVIEYALGEVPRSGKAPPAPQPAAAKPLESNDGCVGLSVLLLFVIALGFCTQSDPKPNPPAPAPVAAVSAPLAPVPEPARPPEDEVVPAVVTGMAWTRVVYLEERRVVTGEGWELPDSAKVLEQEERVRDHEERVASYREVERQVERTETVSDGTETRTREVSERVRSGTRTYVCGQRDMGNGYFDDIECTEPTYETRTRTERYEVPRTREVTRYETVTDREPVYETVPIYATHYRYRGPVWSRSRELRERGDTSAPVWPRVKLRPREREEAREEVYGVSLRTAAGDEHHILLPLAEWQAHRMGSRVALRRSWQGLEGMTALAVDSARITLLPADSLPACRSWRATGDAAAPPDSLGCSAPAPE